tara:strand:- start:304 stop:570 length:267 start_codon:yes stop_codon:yes gene_type:complete
MIKYIAIPLILVGCTAPVTDPPAHAIPREQMEMIMGALEYLREYEVNQNRTEPDDAINSALNDFWEDTDGSNDTTESEELLQLPSDGD